MADVVKTALLTFAAANLMRGFHQERSAADGAHGPSKLHHVAVQWQQVATMEDSQQKSDSVMINHKHVPVSFWDQI